MLKLLLRKYTMMTTKKSKKLATALNVTISASYQNRHATITFSTNGIKVGNSNVKIGKGCKLGRSLLNIYKNMELYFDGNPDIESSLKVCEITFLNCNPGANFNWTIKE